MCDAYSEFLKKAQEVIDYNKRIIYKTPKKYIYLNKALEHEGIRKTILKVYTFIKDKNLYTKEDKAVFHVDNRKLTKLRKKTTFGVSNHYINYICCMGLLNKVHEEFYAEKTDDGWGMDVSMVNYKFFRDTYKDRKRINRPINTFRIKRYSEKELERLEQRTKQLIENGITPKNISNDFLREHNCTDLAEEVFYKQNDDILKQKRKQLKQIFKEIDKLIALKGYAQKNDIKCVDKKRLNLIFKQFREDIDAKYIYRYPKKADIEKFHLKNRKMIILERKE